MISHPPDLYATWQTTIAERDRAIAAAVALEQEHAELILRLRELRGRIYAMDLTGQDVAAELYALTEPIPQEAS